MSLVSQKNIVVGVVIVDTKLATHYSPSSFPSIFGSFCSSRVDNSSALAFKNCPSSVMDHRESSLSDLFYFSHTKNISQ